jgi:hypothetical protein
MHYSETATESRIQLDESDWAIRFGVLQEAASSDVWEWISNDGVYGYNLTSSRDPYSGIGYFDRDFEPTHILDPEYNVQDGKVNPGPWIVGRRLMSVLIGTRPTIPQPAFNIDEKNQKVSTIIFPNPVQIYGLWYNLPVIARDANFRDISELVVALDALELFLRR